jgi:hypothetical protein
VIRLPQRPIELLQRRETAVVQAERDVLIESSVRDEANDSRPDAGRRQRRAARPF